jgi:co-chaperonin GroES (HSP10)
MILDIKNLRALTGKVLVHNIEQGEKRTKHGIIILDDNGKSHGIHERWAQIYALGPDITDIEIGQWILIKHGRWSRGIDIKVDNLNTTIRQVDYPDAILLVSDDCPIDN